MPRKKTPRLNAIVVAHPDDEALFFAGLLMSRRKYPWHVICVTDGNADGAGKMRAEQFKNSCRLLKVSKCEQWDFPDIFEQRLDVTKLVSRLETLPDYEKVYTHGILGEYGHFHHQDVSYATHLAFVRRSQVLSVAYNIYPKEKLNLSPAQFDLKTKILWKVYGSETQRLINLIPATTTEGFSPVSLKEVQALYSFLAMGKTLEESHLKNFKWLGDWIKGRFSKLQSRPF